MKAFTHHVGLVVPLDRANIDTDGILPKQFMKSIERTGFGEYLFDEWRYLDHGEPGMDCSKRKLNPDFPLNQERYKCASILVTRENFGCGSSREHAPWALRDFGIKVIISPSFASIFYGNCLKNGLLPITLKEKEIDEIFYMVDEEVGYSLSIDLFDQTVKMNEGKTILFDIDATIKRNLQLGLDDIALTLKHYDTIKKYEKNRNKQEPWLNILSSL